MAKTDSPLPGSIGVVQSVPPEETNLPCKFAMKAAAAAEERGFALSHHSSPASEIPWQPNGNCFKSVDKGRFSYTVKTTGFAKRRNPVRLPGSARLDPGL